MINNKDIGTKSNMRERYELEVAEIKLRYGTLEDMRAKLGLTKRRMAEFLLVDPSAWTRWTSEENTENAPLHVYKTMSFLMAQFEENPAQFDENKRLLAEADFKSIQTHLKKDLSQQVAPVLEDARQSLREEIFRELEQLKKMAQTHEELSFGWKILLMLNSVAVLYLILFR